MARPLVFDSTAFIEVIRRPELWPPFERHLYSGRVWLSSVVVAELLAATANMEETRLIEDIVAAMLRVPPMGRLLTPDLSDWTRTGRLIARRTRLQGSLRPRDHMADVLILVSTARLRGEVVTANGRHFQSWATLARASGMDVVVSPSAL